MTEKELQQNVVKAAKQLGWKVAHFSKVRTDKGWRTQVAADAAGFPDLVLAHRRFGVLFIELKQDGKYPTPAQREWNSVLTDGGARAYVFREKDWNSGLILDVLQRSHD